MRARIAFFGALLLTAALAACGGGGGGSSPVPSTTPTPTVTTSPGTGGQVTFGSSATTAPLPAGAGVTGSVSIPSGSGTATFSASATLPSGAPIAIQAKHRLTAGGNTALAYVTITASTAVTINGIPGVTLSLPAAAPAGTYFIAYYADASASPRPQAPAWISSTTTGAAGTPGASITIPATTTPKITLAAGQSLFLALYVGGYIPPININGCVGVQARSATFIPEGTGVHPISNGDAYSYTGTLANTMVRSQPCPQPTATANAAVAIQVNLSGGTETSVETDTYPTNTTSLTTNATVTTAPNGVYEETAETAADTNGNSVATTYSTPLQFAQLPDAQGNTWNGVVPSTVNQTLADGTTIDRTYNASSSIYYRETQTLPAGYGANIATANNDGSGSYEIGSGMPYDTTVQMSAPGSTITITIGQQSLVIPSWFPTGFTAGSLYKDVTTDLGTVASLPSGCTSPVTPTPTIEHLKRTITSIDPVLGTIETETVDSYDEYSVTASSSGWFGPVCVALNDSLAQYYDWSATTTYGFYVSFNAQPVLTNTIAETLSLGSGFTALARQHSDGTVRSELAARQSGVRFTRLLQRAQLARRAATALHVSLGGGF